MDLNYILAREQVERALGRAAAGPASRDAHNAMADRYRGMIDRRRRASHGHVDGATILATGTSAAA